MAACAGRPAPAPAPTPPPAQPVPYTETEIRAIARLLRSEDERRLDTAEVRSLSADSVPEIRRRAALALGRIGDMRATPLLLAALSDPVAAVRRDAAFALGELGDTSAAVTGALAIRSGTDEPQVAAEAVAALGKLPVPSSLDALAAVLGPPAAGTRAPATTVVEEALLAVWRLAGAERTLERIAPLLAAPDSGIRWRATYAVMRIGTPSSVRLLLGAVADPDPLVRTFAVRGLRRPVADSAALGNEAQTAVVAALADAHPHVRINALNALATWGEPSLAGPIAARLADGDGNVRIAAAQALPQVKGSAAALALLAVASDRASPTGVRAAALGALLQLDRALGARVAADWSAAASWLMRLHAVRAVSGLEWNVAESVLNAGAHDPHALVAAAAMNAAIRASDTPAAARALFIEGLRREDPAVRAAAIRGLSRRAGPEDLASLLDAYERATRDSSNVAALAAVDGLSAVRDAGVPVGNVFFSRFAPAADPDVRRRVAQRLGGNWPPPDPPPAPSPRPDSFYVGAVRRLLEPVRLGGPPPRLVIRVREGEIVIELTPEDAPLTVLNMITLVESGFYEAGGDTERRRWHRVVPNFVLQDGDPRGDGGGGSGYAIRDEINRQRYGRGVLGMALSGPDTGGSQFFITHSPQPHLDGGYTIFGRVLSGMDIADRIVQDEPILDMRILWP